ncbi:hypothetical protein ABEG63_15515 [Chryseobacterium sp. C39-AII1]|uniref:hypothetical protein n=1 Tax=Chryseobacterium sp. C39-AII1 TaxID=3080332 RepID=UPI003207B285
MKKYFLLSMMSSVVFCKGCSSNDENETIITDPVVGPPALLSKITTVYYDNPSNPETTVATLEYNSQKQLSKIISEGRTSVFEYDTAGKPVKTNYYKADGTLEYYAAYIYNGEQLTTVNSIYSNSDYNRSITYNYNNGKLSGYTQCQSGDCSKPSTSTYTYNGDNIATEIYVSGGTFSFSTKREFVYDNKLNPFSYTNKYFRTTIGGAYVLSPNNYTSEKISNKDNAGNWIPNQNITYEIQYNSHQLPTQVIGKEANGNMYVKYNYEYITQ